MYTPDAQTLDMLFLTAFRAALEGGRKVMEIYNSDNDRITMKSDNSPVSLGDEEAHNIIKQILNPTRIPIMSEEGRDILFEERKSWDMLWIVDPLDGTRQFIKKSPNFTINISLILDGYPIFGIIFAPAIQDLYFGHKDYGSARLHIENINLALNYGIDDINQHSVLLKEINKYDSNSFTILVSEYHTTQDTIEYIEEMKKQYNQVEVKSIGSSLKMCLLAEGKADIYIRHHNTYEWDTAAAQAILEGAGYSIVSIDTNERLAYNKESLLNPWFICKKGKPFL